MRELKVNVWTGNRTEDRYAFTHNTSLENPPKNTFSFYNAESLSFPLNVILKRGERKGDLRVLRVLRAFTTFSSSFVSTLPYKVRYRKYIAALSGGRLAYSII